jgi:hypothetical protein
MAEVSQDRQFPVTYKLPVLSIVIPYACSFEVKTSVVVAQFNVADGIREPNTVELSNE